MTHRRLLLLVVAVAVVAGACGVSADDDPRAIPGTVPFRLLEPTVDTTTTTAPLGETTTRVTIYLTDAEGLLVDVRREVAAPATVEDAIEALLLGPTEDEARRVSTQITSNTQLLGVQGPEDGLVTVNLSRQLLDITGRPQILALAQVVYTATSFPAVDRVLFRFEGQRAEVPNVDGELTPSPVGRRSYRGLVRSQS